MNIAENVRFLEGRPKQYRFDAKEGVFNINGTEKLGRVFSFQPMAWRIFTDNILNMGKKTWAELFFIDDKNCVSAILFHGYSVDNIFRLIEPLFYDEMTLADVVLTITAEKKENTNVVPKGVYYIASFAYTLAGKEQTEFLADYADQNKIYREETLTDRYQLKTAYKFYNPFDQDGLDPKLVAGAARLAEQDAANLALRGIDDQGPQLDHWTDRN